MQVVATSARTSNPMNEEHLGPSMSPLCTSIDRDGKSVRVDIYESGEGGWILELVDAFNNSTVWDESFAKDHHALMAAIKAIDSEGIDSFIGIK